MHASFSSTIIPNLILHYYTGAINFEECTIGAAQTSNTFNFLSGLFFIIVLVTLVLVLCIPVHCTDGNSYSIINYLIIFMFIVSITTGIGDIVYNSFYVASQVYGQFDEFQQQGQVNCSSFMYYCLFELVAIVLNHIFVEITLISLLYSWLTRDFHES